MSHTRIIALLVAGLFLQAFPALAEDWLSDGEIETSLKGQMLEGVYADGRHFTETYGADGRVEYVEDGEVMHGHWSVTSGTLCTIYESDPSGGCFRVVPSGRNCFEFYFVSRTEAQAPGLPGTRPDWTARGMIGGKAESCPDHSSV